MKRARPLVAAISVTAIVAGVLTGTTASTAAWTDTEFVTADVGSLDCASATDLASRATGRFVTGRLGGVPLDPIVGLSGATVSNDGTTVSASSGSVPSGTDAFGAPIGVSAVGSLITAGIGATLPLNWGTGVYNQYGQARETGVSTGASGAVTNSGAVDTGAVAGGTAAKVGTLRLSDLTGLGPTLAGLTDVTLAVGAVAALATMDGCPMAWDGRSTPDATELQRSYLLSSLEAELTSTAVRQLTGPGGTVPTSVATLQSALTGLIGTPTTSGTAETSVANSVLSSLTGTVSGLLGALSSPLLALSIGNGHEVSVGVGIDLTAVTNYLTGPLTDGAVTVDLASGRISVNIDALSGGLNNRAPNTRLLTSANLADVVDRVETLLAQRLAQVNTALTTALNAATVSISVDVKVAATLLAVWPLPGIGPVNALNVHLGYTGSVAQFAAGTQTVTGPSVTLLSGTGIGDALLNPLVGGLTAALLNPVLTTVTPGVVSAVATQLTTPITGLISTVLTTSTTALSSTILALDPVLQTLAAILDITVNAQPDVAPNPAPPTPSQPGEFHVSALRIGVLNAPSGSSLLSLSLANASVGANGR